jgi:hypothetical protein
MYWGTLSVLAVYLLLQTLLGIFYLMFNSGLHKD